jgi:hypothetical protein
MLVTPAGTDQSHVVTEVNETIILEPLFVCVGEHVTALAFSISKRNGKIKAKEIIKINFFLNSKFRYLDSKKFDFITFQSYLNLLRLKRNTVITQMGDNLR